MSDRIALLRSGELEQVATPREIYSRPATAYTAQFIGHTNLLKCEISNSLAQCSGLSWPISTPDGPTLFSLRPEHIRVGSSGANGTVRVCGRILTQAFHGATELIRVDCGSGLVLMVRTSNSIDTQKEVELEFSPSDAVLVRESPERI